MNFISIVALLVGISSHALAAIPVPTTHVDEDILERQPRLRGFDPDFFEQSFDIKETVALSKTAKKIACHFTAAAKSAVTLSNLAAVAATDASDKVAKVALKSYKKVAKAALKAAYKAQKEVTKSKKLASKLVLGSSGPDEEGMKMSSFFLSLTNCSLYTMPTMLNARHKQMPGLLLVKPQMKQRKHAPPLLPSQLMPLTLLNVF